MRVHMVTSNMGGMFPDDAIDEATYSGPSPGDLARVASWRDGIISRLQPRENLPTLIAVCMQELGGKCKKNWDIMARPGGLFAVMMHQLHEAVSSLYAEQGRTLWTSELAFNHHQSLPPGADSKFFSGGPCPKQPGQDSSTSSAKSSGDEDGAVWMLQEYPHIEVDGNVAGFTGLACLFMADQSVIDSGHLQMYHFGQGKWMSPMQGLSSLRVDAGISLAALEACHHRKMYTDSRKGFLHTRWWMRREGGTDAAASERAEDEERGRGPGPAGAGGECVDVVNVHLIHDHSNLQSAATSPSHSAIVRQMMLRRILALVNAEAAAQLWVVGDFNFRPDLSLVLAAFPSQVELLADACIRVDAEEAQMWNLFRPKDTELAAFNRTSAEAFPCGPGMSGVRLLECGGDGSSWRDTPADWQWSPTYNINNPSPPANPPPPDAAPPRLASPQKHRYCKKRFMAWCDRILGSEGAWRRLHINSVQDAEEAMRAGRLQYSKALFDSDHDMVSLSFSAQ